MVPFLYHGGKGHAGLPEFLIPIPCPAPIPFSAVLGEQGSKSRILSRPSKSVTELHPQLSMALFKTPATINTRPEAPAVAFQSLTAAATGSSREWIS